MDKAAHICYHNAMILTLSIGCVKGAYNRIRCGTPQLICRCRTGQRFTFLSGKEEKIWKHGSPL